MSEIKTIGKDYSTGELLKFAAPSVTNEIVISLLYTLDDGLFISRYIGHDALAAFSIGSPLFMLNFAAVNLLGGSAILVSRKFGEKKEEEARKNFTTVVVVILLIGILMAIVERTFLKQILHLLGATEILYPYAWQFNSIGTLYIPLALVAGIFSRFYVTAGKPQVGLLNTVLNVGTNVFFDWYFVVYRQIGMVGAAYANLIAVCVQMAIGLIFYSSKASELRFARPDLTDISTLKRSMRLGIPSCITNASVGLGTLVQNHVILHWGNEEYLAAYSIVNNIAFTFMGGFFGLFGTTGPLVSYAVGEKNLSKLQKLFGQIFTVTTVLSFLTVGLFLTGGRMLVKLFVSSAEQSMIGILNYGMRIMPYSFLLFGYNIAARSTMANLQQTRYSGFLTVMHEIVFNNLTLVLLPLLFGLDSVWFSFLLTNVIMLVITIIVILRLKPEYYPETAE
ncbi:MAG: hypothetical protein IKX74_04315 [Erysipelotrichaceae bacterium]|nr:hypothetical protein [Erysipelotrichaceae bacterium]